MDKNYSYDSYNYVHKSKGLKENVSHKVNFICSIYRGVQKVLMPMFWFDQYAELSSELASKAKVRPNPYLKCLSFK